ncbi:MULTISPECIES: membrane protein insertase YidC [Nocardiopsis]|uniref:Membrane protein insertase YidC n=1 Tax=Nocardiopsis dassonvillei (strain ATCC 23218 / DSM 43111 / CIP 107115 / JCM 7437 / KCTC 9190 / NBRC 14626 / NCTC 10488 / NRRL B-5397 / IMRU 509) TaxID=446468 RepID=D7B9L5_NOCDD|nr:MULTISPECIES: membrane protein insertase YidC [Nocardiopsis]ADH70873.1 membrane protein insertase, YidC/Oxa1 family [Nocardiopsis dassonvillei subsp. dassonvillei DSM 43111]NKY78114.1 membrane protein insertase YidC [Nocardiopsis dassonvillei]VEI91083.1 SynYidC [Nocardiopsis dassonvillei]
MYSLGPIAAAMTLLSTVLSALTSLLTPLTGSLAAGLAVVALTVVVRLLLVPLGVVQVRAEKARARLAPQLAKITARHRGNPERLVAEQRRVYAEAGTSPLAGCLPSLAQVPVMIALYGVFIGAGSGEEEMLAHTFGGVELGATLTGGAGGAAVFAALLALIALVAWANRRYLMLPAMRAGAEADPGRPQLPGLLTYMQFTTVAVAAFVPLAAGLYLLTSSAWALGERLLLRRVVPD